MAVALATRVAGGTPGVFCECNIARLLHFGEIEAAGTLFDTGTSHVVRQRGDSVPVKLPLPGGPSIRRVVIIISTPLRPLPYPLFSAPLTFAATSFEQTAPGKYASALPIHENMYPARIRELLLILSHQVSLLLLVGVYNFTWTLWPRVEDGCIFLPSPTVVSFKPRPPLS